MMEKDLSSCNCIINVTRAEVVTNHVSAAEVWGFGFLFVTLINISIFLGALVLPLMHKNAETFQKVLTFMIGLAVGSLSGSAVYHLIPQGLNLPEEESNIYLWKCLTVTMGTYLFFITERFLKILIEIKRNKKLKTKEIEKPMLIISDNRRMKIGLQEQKEAQNWDPNLELNVMPCNGNKETNEYLTIKQNNKYLISNENNYQINEHISNRLLKACSHDHGLNLLVEGNSSISTVAYMILLGDGLHNFVDGLSIGAAFTTGLPPGISVSIAVLCEEIPHELGDFAILLKSGMSVRRALLCNFLSSCTCYLGLIVGILLGNITESAFFIFSLAAGMFLYISLVDMLPEMIHAVDEASKKTRCNGLKILLIQNLGYLIGTSVMFLLAFFNKNIKF